MTQHLRISQFVITYGPGSIIEGIEGPRVIPKSDIGIFNNYTRWGPSDYEIFDQRMTHGLLKGARIYRLPSNAELGLPDDSYIYATKAFPIWKLCLNTRGHSGNFYVLYAGDKCPECGGADRKGREAIRFIMACPDGHMDEVNWYFLAHGPSSGCQHSESFRWYASGGSLSDIQVECPKCGSKKFTLGWAYRSSWPCTGRSPDAEPLRSSPIGGACKKDMKIIQRQASNLRIPELLTLFSIPPRTHTALHNLLQIGPIFDGLVSRGGDITSKDQLEKILRNLKHWKRINHNSVDEILQCPWPEIKIAINDVLSPMPSAYNEFILEEFRAFIDGSNEGIPPTRLPTPKSPIFIEISPHLVRRFSCGKGTRFRITPVSRLKTVMVQRGYRRAVDTQVLPKLVNVSFLDSVNPQQRWYPGVEFFGEGIFITFDDSDGWGFKVAGETAQEWTDAFNNSSSYPEHVFRDSNVRQELHPMFVWWHTLSHLLMRAIAMEAGYSSAAIRERIYFESQGSRIRGGALLYATQPGSEGTLGGLIALVPYFQDMLETAFDQLHTCSTDPLCLQQKFRIGSYNGAACHGCLLISETSCEHRNMWLDRNILLENLP